MHAWICICPSGDPEARGIQQMLEYESASDLNWHVARVLKPWGAALEEPLTGYRYNERVSIVVPPLDGEFWVGSGIGLALWCFPCTADGANVDVDPHESWAE